MATHPTPDPVTQTGQLSECEQERERLELRLLEAIAQIAYLKAQNRMLADRLGPTRSGGDRQWQRRPYPKGI